jgi:hypothetical protein
VKVVAVGAKALEIEGFNLDLAALKVLEDVTIGQQHSDQASGN